MNDALLELERLSTELGGEIEGLILDLRWNRGGWDSVALALASHFFASTTPVLTKRTRQTSVVAAGKQFPCTLADAANAKGAAPKFVQNHNKLLPYEATLSVVPVQPPAKQYLGPVILVCTHELYSVICSPFNQCTCLYNSYKVNTRTVLRRYLFSL